MTPTDEPPALAHIERMLADAYRREIEQEENIWRSLPFFGATLALQLTALFQVVDRLPPFGTWTGRAALLLLAVSAGCSLAALSFLAASIYPARFDYLAKEAALLDYATELMRDEADPAQAAGDPFSAVVTLKTTLARQYAVATDHNRQINKRRERRRSIAGLATIAAVLSTFLLVATAFAHYLPNHIVGGTGYGSTPLAAPIAASPGCLARNDRCPEPAAGSTAASPSPADAGDHQGLVGAP